MILAAFEVPIRAPSTPNLREHWATRHRRTAAQKAAVRNLCPRWTHAPLLIVRLVRIAPRQLDTDNCAAALKSIRDAVASWLRIDDASPLVRWEYWQEKGEPGVRVEVVGL